jgi:hypothetical protein
MAFTFKVKKRCRFCGTVLREDGTCPSQKCPRYVPDKPKEEEPSEATTIPTQDDSTPSTGGNE